MVTVAVIDDHPATRLGIIAALDKVADIEVVGEADSGPRLWELLGQVTPNVLLLDISMPDFDIFEGVARLQREYPRTRIVIVTIHDDEKHVQRLAEAGVNGYLIKEEPLTEYVKAIRTVARGGTYYSQRVIPTMLGLHAKEEMPKLTPRELEVLELLATGISTDELADELFITTRTATTHLSNIYRKLGVNGRTAAMRRAIELGIITV